MNGAVSRPSREDFADQASRCARCRTRARCRGSCSRARGRGAARPASLVVGPAPSAHAPGAESDLGDRRTHASEWSVSHPFILPGVRPAASASSRSPYIAKGSAAPPSDALPLDLPAHLCLETGVAGERNRHKKLRRQRCMRTVCRVPLGTGRFAAVQGFVISCLGSGSSRRGRTRRLRYPESRIPNPESRIVTDSSR